MNAAPKLVVHILPGSPDLEEFFVIPDRAVAGVISGLEKILDDGVPLAMPLVRVHAPSKKLGMLIFVQFKNIEDVVRRFVCLNQLCQIGIAQKFV
jgi:hypothetical protein